MCATGRSFVLGVATALTMLLVAVFAPQGASAQVTAFKQAVAENAADDDDIAAFYRENAYVPLWTGDGEEDRRRRQALIQAIGTAGAHGLPVERYDADGLLDTMRSARTPRDLGRVEVLMSRTFLELARALQTGIVKPSEIDSDIKREVPYRDRTGLLAEFADSSPTNFFRSLPPQTNEYARLMKEKLRLERLADEGGWGRKVAVGSLGPGDRGNAVVALRDRLIAMGFLDRSSSLVYDTRLEEAVRSFQQAHGLEEDGVAGGETMRQINTPIGERLKSLMVAMERERWLNRDRGTRHVLVNLTDFSARIVDRDKVTFRTRAVVGMNAHDRRTPEFSDEIEHMIINPIWHVPRSIVVGEYLPQMQANPAAAGHLRLYRGGQQISRAGVNFNAYNARTFPFDLKQPPSASNALGLVKYMFPNKYNIYLHDTPTKHLFQRNVRAYSHGCIRLHQPFEFGYTLLARQRDDPKRYFDRIKNSGQRTQVDLDQHVPVHIIYRTAFTTARGQAQYRKDVYGRDARIWNALSRAGVSLRSVRG
ncbi:murein L,D-transpeptidase [Roseovarius sp. TE539]|nr:murein L,D-transpeptidase [Roseovarius sp. TE539]